MQNNTSLKRRSYFAAAKMLGVVIAIAGLASPGYAQSTDHKHPTPMTSREVTDRIKGRVAEWYYYSFVAGPGEVVVSFDGQFAPQAYATATVQDPDTGEKWLSLDLGAGSEPGHFQRSGRIRLTRQQPVLLQIYVDGSTNPPGELSYRVQLDGAVQVGDSKLQPGQSNKILPSNGTLRLEFYDGTIREIDLSRVRDASIRQVSY